MSHKGTNHIQSTKHRLFLKCTQHMNWHMLSFYSWIGADFIHAHNNDDNKANKYCYFVFSSSTEINDA